MKRILPVLFTIILFAAEVSARNIVGQKAIQSWTMAIEKMDYSLYSEYDAGHATVEQFSEQYKNCYLSGIIVTGITALNTQPVGSGDKLAAVSGLVISRNDGRQCPFSGEMFLIHRDSAGTDEWTITHLVIEPAEKGRTNAEFRQLQCEMFYQAGIDDLSHNRFNEARNCFEQALSVIPDYKDTNERIKNIRNLREKYYNKIAADRIETIDKEFEKGLTFFTEGKYNEAEISFEKVLELDPNNNLARSYLEKTRKARQGNTN